AQLAKNSRQRERGVSGTKIEKRVGIYLACRGNSRIAPVGVSSNFVGGAIHELPLWVFPAISSGGQFMNCPYNSFGVACASGFSLSNAQPRGFVAMYSRVFTNSISSRTTRSK